MIKKIERARLEKNKKKVASEELWRQKQHHVMGADEDEQFARLSQEITDMQIDMMSFTEQQQAWLSMDNVDQRTNEQRIMSKIYQGRMLFMCVEQLRGGVNVETLASAMGMYFGMMLVNPELRKQMDKAKATALDSAITWLEKNPDKKILGMRSSFMKGATKKRDDYLRAANDGRMPFTPESAAMADIVMSREAYKMMRDGKHDVDKVMEMYNNARDVLYETAGRDGVAYEDIARSQRTIIGKAMERDETVAKMFSESTFGDWQRSKGYTIKEAAFDKDNNPYMQTRVVWTGEYERMGEDGQPVPVESDAMFSVSKPMDDIDFARRMADIMDEHDGAFDFNDIKDKKLARQNLQAAIAQCFDNDRVQPDIRDDDVGAIYENIVDNMKLLFDRANDDWFEDGPDAWSNKLKKFQSSIGMGVAYGSVREQSASLYARYSNPNDALTATQAIDISSLSMAFVEHANGATPWSKEYQEAANTVADWYALMNVKDDLGYDLDDDALDTSKLEVMLDDNPRLLRQYRDIHDTMMLTINEYGNAVYESLSAGNDFDRTMFMMKEAEDKGSQSYYIDNGVTVSAARKVLDKSRENSQILMNQVDDSLFRDMAESMRRQYQEERARARSAQAEVKFGDINDINFDSEYGE